MKKRIPLICFAVAFISYCTIEDDKLLGLVMAASMGIILCSIHFEEKKSTKTITDENNTKANQADFF